MAACEDCWNAAYTRSRLHGGSQVDHYHELLKDDAILMHHHHDRVPVLNPRDEYSDAGGRGMDYRDWGQPAHNHFTRDVRPPGECPRCDSNRAQHTTTTTTTTEDPR